MASRSPAVIVYQPANCATPNELAAKLGNLMLAVFDFGE
jgi:hypothetical protein